MNNNKQTSINWQARALEAEAKLSRAMTTLKILNDFLTDTKDKDPVELQVYNLVRRTLAKIDDWNEG